jgi:hypothetical protein
VSNANNLHQVTFSPIKLALFFWLVVQTQTRFCLDLLSNGRKKKSARANKNSVQGFKKFVSIAVVGTVRALLFINSNNLPLTSRKQPIRPEAMQTSMENLFVVLTPIILARYEIHELNERRKE